tara:strand:+ start:185 stop:799 length:615 start_codon:yes stop_codon:yes gene_type:complete
MRIKLRESQYSRLLKENDKDFLNGNVNFKEIGNKVDKFIIRCYNFIRRQYPNFIQLRDVPMYSKKLAKDLVIPDPVSLIICYNYYLLWNKLNPQNYEGDLSEMLGEPLEFYGEFELNEEVPLRGYLSGYQMGTYTGYASNEEDFLDQLENGEYYDMDVDHGSGVEYDGMNIDWEVDDGYVDDYLSQRVGDNRNDIEDNVHLVDQ